MQAIFQLFIGAAIVSWISGVIHTLMIVSHRQPNISVAGLMFRGYLFYNRKNFQESGHAIWKRMMLSFAGFIGFLFLALVTSAAL